MEDEHNSCKRRRMGHRVSIQFTLYSEDEKEAFRARLQYYKVRLAPQGKKELDNLELMKKLFETAEASLALEDSGAVPQCPSSAGKVAS